MLPRQRKLTQEQESKAQRLMLMHANKKRLQQEMMVESGHPVLLKDLSNISAKAKVGRSRNQLDAVMKQLRDTYGATVRVSTDENAVLRGIFFQDEALKLSYASFPEMVFIDATYKVLELRLTVYISLVEDGNGQSEVVGISVLVSEDEVTITWLLDTFKEENVDTNKLRVVMADKDMTEREEIKTVFPDAVVLICLFHTLRTFSREITPEKMDITPDQKVHILNIIKKLAYSNNEEEYDRYYQQLMSVSPLSIKNYYNKNWHVIKEE